jgi:hypothetical protein
MFLRRLVSSYCSHRWSLWAGYIHAFLSVETVLHLALLLIVQGSLTTEAWLSPHCDQKPCPFTVSNNPLRSMNVRFPSPMEESSAMKMAIGTQLPSNISPFEKSLSKSQNVQQIFRQLAAPALSRAMNVDGMQLMEIDFPPLLGGSQSKSQFDDFDNISELDANRDWCVQFLANEFLAASKGGKLSNRQSSVVNNRPFGPPWLVFPDDKEVELAKKSWPGALYQKSACYTSLRAACVTTVQGMNANKQNDNRTFQSAWGSSLASTLNKWAGGDGILADSTALDQLDPSFRRLHLICQPGNGGPVEDWINVKLLHDSSNADSATLPSCPTCVVNGALDKVRDGYYPSLFFPALARTVPFFQRFEAVFVLKPISDKGLYGWLFRVYPEPWQVVLQTPETTIQGGQRVVTTKNTIALLSDTRPSYSEAVNALQRATFCGR